MPYLLNTFLGAIDFSNLGWLIAILFILGIALFIIELVMPGIGVAGILGMIALIVGTVLASQVVSPEVLILIIMVILILIAAMLYWMYKSATKDGRISKLLFLNTKTSEEEGYSSAPSKIELLGMEGEAVTPLRPIGTGEFQGRKYDVVSDGEFIPKGAPIKVKEVEGFRIVVEKLED
ncbi:MAG: hypothetical protein GX783_03685 [Clostridiales bacterium]|nr:hypothetical protein [Clostridiales bacterium]